MESTALQICLKTATFTPFCGQIIQHGLKVGTSPSILWPQRRSFFFFCNQFKPIGHLRCRRHVTVHNCHQRWVHPLPPYGLPEQETSPEAFSFTSLLSSSSTPADSIPSFINSFPLWRQCAQFVWMVLFSQTPSRKNKFKKLPREASRGRSEWPGGAGLGFSSSSVITA